MIDTMHLPLPRTQGVGRPQQKAEETVGTGPWLQHTVPQSEKDPETIV